MSANPPRPRGPGQPLRSFVAFFCVALLVPGEGALLAQEPKPAAAAPAAGAAEQAAPKIPPDQLDSLVAPIALYPDPLLAQTLAASTYPLEIIQLQQWLTKNAKLKDKALADAVAKQPWDPAVQSMAPLPDVVKRLADDVQWTTDLGNAFLAQQGDVMEAVQRMRKKAQDKGALASNEQQKVETKVVEQKTVIVVESANPEVIYVPVYSPTVVYPPPVYPYPPIYYPPYPPGAGLVTFTAGVMIGAAVWGGSCCGCGWGHNDVNINVNNNFNQINANRNTNVSGNKGGGNSWQHNSQHRGGTPYSNQATASKYGGSSRGGASASQQARGGGAGGGASASQQGRGGTSASDRSSGGGGGSRGAGASPSASSSGASSRGGGAGASPSSKGGGGGFGGGSSGGFSGSSAKASSSRGASSFGGGGGGRSGGGGRRR